MPCTTLAPRAARAPRALRGFVVDVRGAPVATRRPLPLPFTLPLLVSSSRTPCAWAVTPAPRGMLVVGGDVPRGSDEGTPVGFLRFWTMSTLLNGDGRDD